MKPTGRPVGFFTVMRDRNGSAILWGMTNLKSSKELLEGCLVLTDRKRKVNKV